jgi:nucleotide-binding universal stress UspA family protein
VREGTFINELESVCEDIKPFAVVMGSQGSSASSYRLFGSQSVNTMRQIKWPVIAVPRGAKFGDVRKIGLACDFENVVEKTPIDEIKKLVNNFNAELHVLNTRKKQEQDPQMVFESGLLMEMLTPLSHEYHFITNENIDQGIMDFCEKNNMDLLVVMPGRHNLLDKLIHKSHTKNLVIHSHVPLMALHE